MVSRQHGRSVLFEFGLESPVTCMRSGSGLALSRGLDSGDQAQPEGDTCAWIFCTLNLRKLFQTHEIGGQRIQSPLV